MMRQIDNKRQAMALAVCQWLIWPVLWLTATSVVHASDLLEQYLSPPPEAAPGQCYAKVIVPAKYKSTRHTIVKREASESITIVPAKYEWVDEKVMVREATEVISVVPETYRWVEDTVLVEPVSLRLEPVPATFDTIAEQVLDKPEQISWQTRCGPLQSIEHMTGDVVCLLAEPATYQSITRYIVKQPATTHRVEIPATYKQIRRRVVDKPARIVKTPQPAVFETVKVKKMVTPARVERLSSPVEYQSITKKEKLSDEQFVWRESVCESDLGERGVTSLQRALKQRGFDPGEIDGVLGAGTLGAVEAFQVDAELARGAVTIELLEALQVDY